jgi:hypothetical protein
VAKENTKAAAKKDRASSRTKKKSSTRATLAESSAEAYSDSTPFDRIQYLQAKLILKPDRFTSVQSFREFGQHVEKTARKTGVGFIADPKAGHRPEVREVNFIDTPDFRLYNNAFILRRRIRYDDGFPVGDPEIVFKFRHPDEQTAAAVDVRPNIGGKYRIKFKTEALPLKDRMGGYRLLYSHNCQFGVSQVQRRDRLSMATVTRVFPSLAALKKSDEEKLQLVNEAIVEEVLLPLGLLDFGKGQVAKCDVALWRTRGEHRPLVGEFAFQVKFPSRESVAEKPKRLVAQFFVALQHEVADWLARGVTKTGMVYRLKGNQPQTHE